MKLCVGSVSKSSHGKSEEKGKSERDGQQNGVRSADDREESAAGTVCDRTRKIGKRADSADDSGLRP